MNIAEFIDKAVAFFGFAEKKLNALQSEDVTQLKADLETAKQTISTVTKRAEMAETAVVAHAETIKGLEVQVAEIPQLVAAKANEIAAAQGVPPVREETKESTVSKTSSELWAEYNKLEANDHVGKRNFWLKNRDRM